MLLCMVMIIGIAVNTIGLLICGQYSKEQFQKELNEDIFYNCDTVIARYLAQDNLEDGIPELEEVNMEFAVVQSDSQDWTKVDVTNEKNYIYGDVMKDYDDIQYVGKAGYFDYSNGFLCSSLIGVLADHGYIYEHEENELVTKITDFVYSREDELLLAETASGYFPLDMFTVHRSQYANQNETDNAKSQKKTSRSKKNVDELANEEVDASSEADIEERVVSMDGDVEEATPIAEYSGVITDENREMYQDSMYETMFSYGTPEDETHQTGTDVNCPDVKYLTEDYLKTSQYIYFADEVLYWNKAELFQFCGTDNLWGVQEFFGDSVWPVKFVDKLEQKPLLPALELMNYSAEDRGSVRYVEQQASAPYYWILNKYVENGAHDLFADAKWWVNLIYGFQNLYGLMLIVSVIIFFAAFAYLLAAAGVRSEGNCINSAAGVHNVLHLTIWNRMPWAVYTFGMIMIETLIGVAIGAWVMLGIRCQSEIFWIATLLPLVMIFTMFGIIYCMNMSVRIKSKQFWKFTLCYRIFAPIKKRMIARFQKDMHYLREQTSFKGKIIMLLVVVFFVELIITFISIAVGGAYEGDNVIVLFLFVYVLEAVGIVWVAIQLNQLREGGRRIAAGQLDQPIDTSKMLWEFKKHGEDINSVGDGINAAVQERMKSEHFKTELITNVSHDIKTPLTSIVNYVDLIKKQELTDPTMIEYVDVLDRQSARLKKLIEDLMEASKASTGNLAVNWEKMDITVMLTQVVGEFEERLSAKGLDLIVDNPAPPINVRVDGRHLWRIFDNLMNNICKYAQAGTRVYINMSTQGHEVSIVFRNISAYQLNISSEELMERFVRGDSSRNTEGSGLGLSIAQSLTELMKGTMELNVDGDLFKVVLKFSLED